MNDDIKRTKKIPIYFLTPYSIKSIQPSGKNHGRVMYHAKLARGRTSDGSVNFYRFDPNVIDYVLEPGRLRWHNAYFVCTEQRD